MRTYITDGEMLEPKGDHSTDPFAAQGGIPEKTGTGGFECSGCHQWITPDQFHDCPSKVKHRSAGPLIHRSPRSLIYWSESFLCLKNRF